MRLTVAALGVIMASAAVGSAIAISRYGTALAESGLPVVCSPSSTLAPRSLETVDIAVFTAALQRHAKAFASRSFTCEWRGYLIPPRHGQYRLVAVTNGRVWVDIDEARAIDADWPRQDSTVELGRGLHAIRVRFESSAPEPFLELRWSSPGDVPVSLSPVLFLPDVAPAENVRRHLRLAMVAPIVPAAWTVLGVVCLLFGVWTVARGRQWTRVDRALAYILAVDCVLFATGSWWGLPDFKGWAPDEIVPGHVLAAVDAGFRHGWATIYPPVHYALLAALTSPYHAAAALGLVDLSDLRTYSEMFLLARLLSVAMALGIVAMTFATARELFGRRAAIMAAWVVSVALPLTYYAKTANVDVPYVFWFALSMFYYMRALRTGTRGSFYLFALFGVIAICTKDQAAGFYILPAAYLLGRVLLRRKRSAPESHVPTLRVAGAMMFIVAAGIMVFDNVVFNPTGFREHVRILAGNDYRMYPGTPAGHSRLFGTFLWQLGEAMSWPLLLAGAAAVWFGCRTSRSRLQWVGLPIASYYLCFVAIIGYHYDRFLLGVIVLLSLITGWWLDAWTATGVRFRPARMVILGCVLAYGYARCVSLDLLMLRDSRYTVEQWLVSHVSARERVAAVGFATYLPRASMIRLTPIDQDTAALAREKPDLVVVNAGFSQRQIEQSNRPEFYRALAEGRTDYSLVLRYRSFQPFSPLNWDRRFTQAREDPFSNLTKINPVIEIYRLQRP